MNKYQKRKSAEIKKLMKYIDTHNPSINVLYGSVTLAKCSYKLANRLWSIKKRLQWCSPCEDCDNSSCRGPFNVIAFCQYNR